MSKYVEDDINMSEHAEYDISMSEHVNNDISMSENTFFMLGTLNNIEDVTNYANVRTMKTYEDDDYHLSFQEIITNDLLDETVSEGIEVEVELALDPDNKTELFLNPNIIPVITTSEKKVFLKNNNEQSNDNEENRNIVSLPNELKQNLLESSHEDDEVQSEDQQDDKNLYIEDSDESSANDEASGEDEDTDDEAAPANFAESSMNDDSTPRYLLTPRRMYCFKEIPRNLEVELLLESEGDSLELNTSS